MDFTLEKYQQLCQALYETGYDSWNICTYFETPPDARPERLVLIRHDVDGNPRHALKLAQIERQNNLVATYFFRTVGSAYNPNVISTIAQMGHGIGYHYETLSQTHGDINKAITLFRKELAKLRQFASVEVASMHGAPLKPWDNRLIWQHVTPADVGLVGEVYRDIDYTQVQYFSDTGRTWHPTRYNLRDHTERSQYQVETTAEFIKLIRSGKLRHLAILAHPERWADNIFYGVVQMSRDVGINLVKSGIQYLRG